MRDCASLATIKKIKGAGPSQRTLGESLRDSQDGPGARKTWLVRPFHQGFDPGEQGDHESQKDEKPV